MLICSLSSFAQDSLERKKNTIAIEGSFPGLRGIVGLYYQRTLISKNRISWNAGTGIGLPFYWGWGGNNTGISTFFDTNIWIRKKNVGLLIGSYLSVMHWTKEEKRSFHPLGYLGWQGQWNNGFTIQLRAAGTIVEKTWDEGENFFMSEGAISLGYSF